VNAIVHATDINLSEHRPDTRQVVSFRLCRGLYALDILHVQEIIKTLPVTPVPRTPPWIAGVINLRGQIMPLLDLALRLQLRTTPNTECERFMIVRGKPQPLALKVDRVDEVLRLSQADLESPPVTTQQRDYIQSVCRYQNNLIIILDAFKILAERCLPVPTSEEVL
jgi:purine-binding chemotaxis protein CheW